MGRPGGSYGAALALPRLVGSIESMLAEVHCAPVIERKTA